MLALLTDFRRSVEAADKVRRNLVLRRIGRRAQIADLEPVTGFIHLQTSAEFITIKLTIQLTSMLSGFRSA